MPRKHPDVSALQELLLWARKEKIVLRDVVIGSLSVIVERDHGLSLPTDKLQAVERRQTLVEQFAGALLPAMQGATQETNEPTIEDEE